jgi:hypothetical protein
VTVSGCPDGSLHLRLAAGSVTDADGNTLPVSWVDAGSVSLDRTPPDIWLYENSPSRAASTDIMFGITSTSTIECATVSSTIGVDLDASGISELGPIEGNSQSCAIPAVASIPDDTEGWAILSPAPTFSVDDLAGNTATRANGSGLVIVDRRNPPHAVITGPASPTKSGPLAFSVTFDQAITGLAADDFRAYGPAGCTIGEPSALSDREFTVVVTGCAPGILDFFLVAYGVTDDMGNPGLGADAAPVLIDDTAPEMTAGPSVRLRSGATLSGSKVPVFVTYAGTDAGGAGIGHYQLSRSTNGGTTWSTPVSVTTSTYATFVSSTGTVRFKVRAVDGAGNPSAWRTGPSLTARLVQQTSRAVQYRGVWRTSRSTAYLGGSVAYSSAAGGSARYTFTGTSIGWVTTLGPTRGKARIYVNGVYKATVDLHASKWTSKMLACQYRFATSATRTVTIVVVGTVGRPRVDVDAFIVVP